MLKCRATLTNSSQYHLAVCAQFRSCMLERRSVQLHGGKDDLPARSELRGGVLQGRRRLMDGSEDDLRVCPDRFWCCTQSPRVLGDLNQPLCLQWFPTNERDVRSRACRQRVRQRLLLVTELTAGAHQALLPPRDGSGCLDRGLRTSERP
mmetsp:Transcript_109191/g.348375  ORF Transcript_109191/g.348375 Transcript_109191/m.348375 type:complete len:150 (-) Transcript_109191:134-583(-)